MRLFAWTLWALAGIWMVLVGLGAIEFQDLYGGTAGLQALLLGLAVGLIPAAVGWWAYRRSS
jgi:hypothetical protein